MKTLQDAAEALRCAHDTAEEARADLVERLIGAHRQLDDTIDEIALLHGRRLDAIEEERARAVEKLNSEARTHKASLIAEHNDSMAKLDKAREAVRRALENIDPTPEHPTLPLHQTSQAKPASEACAMVEANAVGAAVAA
jgi:hypothetical protein